MSPPLQFGCESIRVLVFRKQASELLVEHTEKGSALPWLQIPSYSRVAEQLTSATERLWGLSVCCLFELAGPGNTSPGRYQVAEAARIIGHVPNEMRWVPVTSDIGVEFQDHADVAAIHAALRAVDCYRSGRERGIFGMPGWLPRVTDWVASQAAHVGLNLTGNFRQLNASPSFSLIRFESNGSALWFKATGEPHRHEYGITLELARRFPRFLPPLVASHAEWNAWLTVEAEGSHLTKMSSLADWVNSATALAELQIASFGHGLQLVESGCKDVRASSLLEFINPFFSGVAQLMSAQFKQLPPPLGESELEKLAEDVRKALDRLSASTVPNVLGHLDCSPGNIVASQARSVFLDWAEGCVGHPFVTFQYLLEYWRKFHGRDHREEDELVSAYTDPWKCFFSPRSLTADLPYIPLVAAFAYAASGSGLSRAAASPETAKYLRSITRRMKREADALQHRELACIR
jgi:hypothetical protein